MAKGQRHAITIVGPPRTKKNHSRIVRVRGKPKIIPSGPQKLWADKATWHLRATWHAPPISGPVNCRAVFYRQANTGDATGYYQALADVLQAGKVLVNDRQIVSWDGSRLDKDAARPRVEVVIEEL